MQKNNYRRFKDLKIGDNILIKNRKTCKFSLVEIKNIITYENIKIEIFYVLNYKLESEFINIDTSIIDWIHQTSKLNYYSDPRYYLEYYLDYIGPVAELKVNDSILNLFIQICEVNKLIKSENV